VFEIVPQLMRYKNNGNRQHNIQEDGFHCIQLDVSIVGIIVFC
jgi:hypothetical protein